MSGGGDFSRRCEDWFEQALGCHKALLTPSCTHALEMAAILIGIQPGDEVILPSYTFVSTANAFVLRGARVVFVDVRPDTMNLDETRIEDAITTRTRAIVPVHYAGVGCAMDEIMDIAERHQLVVIEDAAQAITSMYKAQPLGGIGHLGTFSFHETKNITSGGEGGLLIVNDPRYSERAEIIREKGTNRNQFFRGMVDKYSWVDIGGSYLPSELQAAYLWGQVQRAEEVTSDRLTTWNRYRAGLEDLAQGGVIELPVVPEECVHNGHTFFVRVKDLAERTALLDHLRAHGIVAVFHYVPLHSSAAGRRFGRFHGLDRVTTRDSERLLRLPMFFNISNKDVDAVIEAIKAFYATRANISRETAYA